MKVVFDTNVVITSYLAPQSICATLMNCWHTEVFDLVVSDPLLQEYQAVLNYPKIQKHTRMTPTEMQQAIRNFRQFALLVEPKEEITVVERDRDDNKIIACALAGEAEYIVTGDNDLLSMKAYRGIRILTPAAFLAYLEQSKEPAA